MKCRPGFLAVLHAWIVFLSLLKFLSLNKNPSDAIHRWRVCAMSRFTSMEFQWNSYMPSSSNRHPMRWKFAEPCIAMSSKREGQATVYRTFPWELIVESSTGDKPVPLGTDIKISRVESKKGKERSSVSREATVEISITERKRFACRSAFNSLGWRGISMRGGVQATTVLSLHPRSATSN
ncbi:uncharacterized protein LOC143181818 isoform X1 [Calliopsis andreniformis]|uniref:uncharacterized protein LOC143181818 isoform X1 n=1 Tax=Calliopsis andreniformis TaxID=337506 RepID=UPI003FCCE162